MQWFYAKMEWKFMPGEKIDKDSLVLETMKTDIFQNSSVSLIKLKAYSSWFAGTIILLFLKTKDNYLRQERTRILNLDLNHLLK